MNGKSRHISVGRIYMQDSELSPLRHERAHNYDRSRRRGGSGDVPVRCGAFSPRDNHPCRNEVGQEEGRGNRIVCAHPHS